MAILLFIILWPFTTLTICPVAKNAKVGTIVCQILNKTFKNLPIVFQNFAKVANLVTLDSPILKQVKPEL